MLVAQSKPEQTIKQKTDYNAKIKDIMVKYFTTADYNRFTGDILDAKIKRKVLVSKFDIADFVKKQNLIEN